MAKSIVKGLAEAEVALQRAGEALHGPKTTQIILRGAMVIRSYAEYLAPRGTDSKRPGTLKRAVMARPMAVRTDKPTGAIVIVNYSPRRGVIAPHAHLVEGGTRPHVIRAKSGGHLRLFGGKVFVESVRHPGAKADPFFAEAVSAKRGEARRVIMAGVAQLIDDATAGRAA